MNGILVSNHRLRQGLTILEPRFCQPLPATRCGVKCERLNKTEQTGLPVSIPTCKDLISCIVEDHCVGAGARVTCIAERAA